MSVFFNFSAPRRGMLFHKKSRPRAMGRLYAVFVYLMLDSLQNALQESQKFVYFSITVPMLACMSMKWVIATRFTPDEMLSKALSSFGIMPPDTMPSAFSRA